MCRFVWNIALLAISSGCLFAGKKVISATTTGSNDSIDITATISMTEDEVTQKLGADPGKGVVLVEVHVVPKVDKPVQVSPDDFILLAHDDGERAGPYEPSQLAGDGALVLKTTGPGGAIGTRPTGATVAGIAIARPSKKPDKNADAKKDTTPTMSDTKTSDTLLEKLKAKQFPDKETTGPVEGFLYFPLDGKHKLKNLAILYRGPTGKVDLEFEH